MELDAEAVDVYSPAAAITLAEHVFALLDELNKRKATDVAIAGMALRSAAIEIYREETRGY
jgi:hypothetical protein